MSGEDDIQPLEVAIPPESDMMVITPPESLDLELNTKSTLDPLTISINEEANLDPKPEQSSLDHALPTEGNVELSLDNLGLEATIPDGEFLDANCDESNVDAIPVQVSPGSIASTGVAVGDVILRVGEAETTSLTHNQCQNHLQAAGNLLQLHIAKGGSASPSITSPQPDQVSTPSHHAMTACPPPSHSSGVHDLFRDMYRQSSQPATNQNYSSRPPPVEATPSPLSPTPSLVSPSSGAMPPANRRIPVQVQQNRPHVVYPADYANGQDDHPTNVNHGRAMGGASEGPSCMSPPPPSYGTLDRDAFRVPSSPTPHTPGAVRTPSHPNTPVKTPQSPGMFSKTPQSPAIGPGRIAASIIDLARRSSYPYAFPPSQATPPSSSSFSSSPSHGGPGTGRQQRYPQAYNQTPPASNRTPPFAYQAHDYNREKPNYQPRPRFPNAPDAIRSLPDGASGSEDLSFPTPPPEAARPAFPDFCGSEPGTPGILPPPPPPPPPVPSFSHSPQPTFSSSPSLDSNKQQYATRLNQQLASGMDNYPTSPGHFPDAQPDYNNYNNYNNADNYDYNSADNGYSAAPKAPPLPSPQTNYRSQPTPPPQVMPDKVLNMAAKGGPDKKPFSYVPDADALKEHRDRVRRRKPSGPDITQSATYKLIHGLDEPAPTTPSQGRRPMEGTQTTHPHACAQASTCDVINSNGDVCDTNGQSGSALTHTNHPVPLQPATSGMYPGRPSTRQGLSFMVLQYLYDNDQDVTSQGPDSGQATSDSGHVTSGMTSESTSTSPGSSSVPSTPGSLSPTSPHSSRHPTYWKRAQRPVRQPSQDDELSFSGVGRDSAYDHIPSRAFHKLQSLTGGSEVDRSSIRGNVSGVSAKPTRRNLRRAESAPHYQEDDDDRDGCVDLAYVGASIPSRSFRMLQQSIGADPSDYEPKVRGYDDKIRQPGQLHGRGRNVRIVTLRSSRKPDAPASFTPRHPPGNDCVTDF